jgi:hypothetical protein
MANMTRQINIKISMDFAHYMREYPGELSDLASPVVDVCFILEGKVKTLDATNKLGDWSDMRDALTTLIPLPQNYQDMINYTGSPATIEHICEYFFTRSNTLITAGAGIWAAFGKLDLIRVELWNAQDYLTAVMP